MVNKSRRVKKKGREIHLSPAQMVQPGLDEAAIVSSASPVAQPSLQKSDLREEYRYVIADLKRIGAIALVMLAALIVLALLLT